MSRKYILLSILLLLSSYLFSETQILDCQQMDKYYPGDTLRITKSITAQKLNREAEEAKKSAKNCLPAQMGQDVKNYLKQNLNIQLVCDSLPDNNCAEAWDPYFDYRFQFSAAAVTLNYEERKGECGCIQGIILHEIIHLATHVGKEGHKEIFGCVMKCTAKIKKCIDYPPLFGCDTDCADFPKKK